MEECYRLHYACELGDCSQVEELLDRGIAVDISDDYSTTPLQVICEWYLFKFNFTSYSILQIQN